MRKLKIQQKKTAPINPGADLIISEDAIFVSLHCYQKKF